MSRDRVALARRLSITVGREAVCRGLGIWWTQQETAHGQATTPVAAAAAAAPALALCAGCPEVQRCSWLAEIDRYTGLAGGAAYLKGARRPPHRVRRVPPADDVLERAAG